MVTATVHFYVLSAGGISIIGFLLRITYVLGKAVSAAEKHVKDSEKIHDDQERRLRVVEGRRR